MEIAMGDGQIETNRRVEEQVAHHNGIDPAAHGKQDRSSFRKQSVQTIVETGLHDPGVYFLLEKV